MLRVEEPNERHVIITAMFQSAHPDALHDPGLAAAALVPAKACWNVVVESRDAVALTATKLGVVDAEALKLVLTVARMVAGGSRGRRV